MSAEGVLGFLGAWGAASVAAASLWTWVLRRRDRRWPVIKVRGHPGEGSGGPVGGFGGTELIGAMGIADMAPQAHQGPGVTRARAAAAR